MQLLCNTLRKMLEYSCAILIIITNSQSVNVNYSKASRSKFYNLGAIPRKSERKRENQANELQKLFIVIV